MVTHGQVRAMMMTTPGQQAQEIERLLQAGALKPALRVAKSARRTFPKEAQIANLSGVVLSRHGQTRAAIDAFRAAARLEPGNDAANRNLAALLLNSGRADEAARLLAALSARRPDDADLARLLAFAHLQSGDPAAATAAATAHLDRHPDDAHVLNLRGAAHMGLSQTAAALADYRSALALLPDTADFHANIAQPLALAGQPDAALAALERALDLAPDHLNALHRYGVHLLQSGRPDAAAAALARLTALAPAHAEGLRELAALVAPDTAPALARQIAAARAATPRKAPAQAALAFAEATLAARTGDPAALDRLDRANATAHRLRPWSAAAFDRAAHAIIEHMPVLPPPCATRAGPRPVFILGLPRSGSSLVEQVLTAHPAIAGLGEHTAAERWMQAHGPDTPFCTGAAGDLARHYRASLPPLPTGTMAFTDKMPGNFRMIGHLLTALPDAVIVHVRRDPLDVAWSMWRAWFHAPGMNFAFDQAAMARYFNAYAMLMAHWQRIAGARIATLDYADLVRDVDAASRRLAALAGLDWHAAMARPHENAAPVRTASQLQVRAPVHARSLGAGHAHADRLGRFLAALDPALWPDLPDLADLAAVPPPGARP
jgi:Flp pilus assembly protein TadD